MEHLLRDYHDAQEELRTLKYSLLKERLISADSSRQAQLQWLGEFMVFVGGNHATLVENPELVFQYALNQVRAHVMRRQQRGEWLTRVCLPSRTHLLRPKLPRSSSVCSCRSSITGCWLHGDGSWRASEKNVHRRH